MDWIVLKANPDTERQHLNKILQDIAASVAAGGFQPLDTQLTDLAGLSYAGNSLKVIRVNVGETGWELAAASAGSGDVVGPASSVADRVVFFDGVTGKLIKDSGLTLSGTNTGDQNLAPYATTAAVAAGYQPLDTQLTDLSALVYGSNALKVVRVNAGETGWELATISVGSGDVVGPASSVDNRVVFFNGVTGKLIKDSGLTLAGSNTGDQTTIVGITGTLAEFNTALTGADFATGGGTVTGTSSGTNTGDQTITLTGPVTGTGTGSFATTITDKAVTLAKMNDVATSTVFYRKTAATGVPEVQTLATLKTDLGLTGTNSGDQTITLTGNVTGSGTGSFAATIANSAVTLAKQADVATSTVFYRKTAGTGAPEVQTLATLKTDLNLTGTNSGDQTSIVGITGTKAQFDTACTDGNFAYASDLAGYQPLDTQLTDLAGLSYVGNTLKNVRVNAGETGWELYTPAGGGDVVGPASAVNNRVVFFDGTTGKLLKDSGLTLAGSNTGDQTITLTGDVTGSGTGSFAASLATAQPTAHTWASTQTFTVAPVFTDQAGSRTALALGTAAVVADNTLMHLAGNETATGTKTLPTPVFTTSFESQRGGVASQKIISAHDGSYNYLRSESLPAAAKPWLFNATTDAANTAPGAGTPAYEWQVLGVTEATLGTATMTRKTTPAAGTNSLQLATTANIRRDVGAQNYRVMIDRSGSHVAGRVAGTYVIPHGDPVAITGTGTLYSQGVFYFDPADYPTVDGVTAKLRIRGQVFCNDVAPTGNFTIGLHPVTRPAVSGGAALVIYTIGAATAACTAIATPAADSSNQTTSADFAMPAAGYYCLGVVTTATVAASAHTHISAQLQMRHA